VSIQTQPDPAGGAPRRTGTGNVTAMLTAATSRRCSRRPLRPLGRSSTPPWHRYDGIHLVAFGVADARERISGCGDTVFGCVRWSTCSVPSKLAERPGTAAFTVARLEPGEMPEGRIQLLTHRSEQVVWQPRWLAHPNGAVGLTSVTIAVSDVDEATQRFETSHQPPRKTLFTPSDHRRSIAAAWSS